LPLKPQLLWAFFFHAELLITVSLGALDHIRIEYHDGTETGAIQTTTDDTLTLYLRGYDADNNLIGYIAGTWTVTQGVGTCTPEYGTSTLFDPTTPGTGTITATDGTHTDITGSVTVRLGNLDHLRIEYPDYTEAAATQTTTDDTLTLCLRGYDADSNLIGDVAGTWTVSGGLENCEPEYGTKTYFDPTKQGTGTITATDGVHADATVQITVIPGALSSIRIEYCNGVEAGAKQIIAGNTLTLYLRGYDADSNLIGDVVGTWTVSGGELENCEPEYGSSTVFNPTKTGMGTITVIYGGYTDTTGLITVSPGYVVSIRIEYLNGTEVGATQITTDDTMELYLRGYDANSNLVGNIIGNWTVSGGSPSGRSLENCRQGYGTSTVFDPTKPASGSITATNDVYTDTTGLITVNLGILNHLCIEYSDGTEAAATQTTTDNSLALYLRGYDADNNLLGDVVGTWTVGGGMGTCTPGYGSSTVIDLITPGAGIITAIDGVHTGITGTITVDHGQMIGLRLTPSTYTLTADDSLQYIATAKDADGNLWDVTEDVIWSEDDPIGTMADSIYYAGRAG
ncbi:MAG: hypothetical protein AAB296_04430, partial [Candidatus Desantisbacteria bacterium]